MTALSLPAAGAERAGAMLYVSLIVEILRARPALMFWIAALGQAALWVAVPSLLYSAPPGDLAEVLAIGREFPLGSYMGPPLAFWLAEIAFRIAGLFGVYVLSQACVVLTYWAVYQLGRAIVGERHAVLAVLVMVGISAFAAASPGFGPAILASALWALILLHFWRAAGERRGGYWFWLGFEIPLLLLTSYVGIVLFGLLLLFMIVSERGRAALRTADPWLAGLIAVLILLPHLIWLESDGDLLIPTLRQNLRVFDRNLNDTLRLFAMLIAAHAGAAVLVAFASRWGASKRDPAPAIERGPVPRFGWEFVYFFAIAPALAAVLFAPLSGRPGDLLNVAPLIVLSGLAIVVAAGNVIRLYRENVVSAAWTAILLIPPLATMLMILVLPWVWRTDLRVTQPANAIGEFFSETFQRRTGRPLEIVAGDPQLAALLAIGAPTRPTLLLDATPDRTPWVGLDDVRKKGAVLVWPATDTTGTPPTALSERFPGLIAEVPRPFPRMVQGIAPPMRVGWAVIRPQGR
jgi:4-amino-4-deoxy-L-arabinose transferase-like glycosyltransferase